MNEFSCVYNSLCCQCHASNANSPGYICLTLHRFWPHHYSDSGHVVCRHFYITGMSFSSFASVFVCLVWVSFPQGINFPTVWLIFKIVGKWNNVLNDSWGTWTIEQALIVSSVYMPCLSDSRSLHLCFLSAWTAIHFCPHAQILPSHMALFQVVPPFLISSIW